MLANSIKADHEILVTLQTNAHGAFAAPALPPEMLFGETVHYSRSGGGPGLVTIEFNPGNSPFVDSDGKEKTEVFSTDPPLKLMKRGTFSCICALTLPGEVPTGWDPRFPKAGGNHIVK
jgi:hypothetical protein